MKTILSSARLKDLSKRLGYTYSNFQSLWNDAVEEASDLGEGDNLGYILRILRELLDVPEKEFQKATQNFIEQSFLKSSINEWNDFLEYDGMIKSDIPQQDIPEVVNKKDRKEESQWIREAIEEEVISSFLQNIGLADKDKETSLKYLDTLQTYLVEPLETEDQKQLMIEFIDLLREQIEGSISEEDKTKLVEYLKALFPDKKGEMTEDVLDQVNDVFGSAFGPIGSRLGDFFSLTKDIVSDIADAAGEDYGKIEDYLKDRKKKKDSDKKDSTTDQTDSEPDFDLTDKKAAKAKEKQDAIDLTPDEFHQKYGKCPKGYQFDSEKQACVKKEVKKKSAKKSSKTPVKKSSTKKSPKKK